MKELQDIQWQIIAFIDRYTENAPDDPLALALRRAITDLNEAKIVIGNRALAEGEMRVVDSSDGSHLKVDDTKAS
jgi:hypothetical protein